MEPRLKILWNFQSETSSENIEHHHHRGLMCTRPRVAASGPQRRSPDLGNLNPLSVFRLTEN